MPSPLLTRDSRIKHLVSIVEAILEGGASQHLLFDKLWALAQRSWPTVRESTRREYVVSAIKTVLSRSHTEPVLPEALGEAPPQEVK